MECSGEFVQNNLISDCKLPDEKKSELNFPDRTLVPVGRWATYSTCWEKISILFTCNSNCASEGFFCDEYFKIIISAVYDSFLCTSVATFISTYVLCLFVLPVVFKASGKAFALLCSTHWLESHLQSGKTRLFMLSAYVLCFKPTI